MLSSIREAEGEITIASELLQELQVETFGSMERREKVDFVLEQMRMLRVQNDWDKLAIVSKKINLKWLVEPDHEVRCSIILALTKLDRCVNCTTGPQASILFTYDSVGIAQREIPGRL